MTTLFDGQIETAAGTYTDTAVTGFGKVRELSIIYNFTAGSGGTSVAIYVQTSLDGGVTWFDIACESLTTSDSNTYQSCVMSQVSTPVAITDASITANTSIGGLLGDRFRTKRVVTGTYSGAELSVYVSAKT